MSIYFAEVIVSLTVNVGEWDHMIYVGKVSVIGWALQYGMSYS